MAALTFIQGKTAYLILCPLHHLQTIQLSCALSIK